MVKVHKLSSQSRDKLSQQVADFINQHGLADKIVAITYSGASDGKLLGGGLLASYVAYIYYKS